MPHMGRTHAMRTTGYAAVLRGDVDGSAPRLIAFESPASCLLATDLDRLADTWVRQRERQGLEPPRGTQFVAEDRVFPLYFSASTSN